MPLLPQGALNPSTPLKRASLTLILLLFWAFILWRAINVFGPSGTANDISYNSDSAIPVLMSNDERPVTLFNLYYYGTDRWGGWPFLAARLVRGATGLRWSDESLFAMQVVWVFIGALVVACLGRGEGALAGIVYLVVLCLHGEARYQMFELSQLYAWQVTALLFAWYFLRRLFESDPGTPEKKLLWARAARYFPAFIFSYLAVWSSVASVPLLFFLLAVEALRGHLRGNKKWGGIRSLKPYAKGFIIVMAAALLEQLMKMNYHRHALKHFGQDFRTSFRLDLGYLRENLAEQLQNIWEFSWWPLYLLATLAALVLVAYSVYALLKKRRESLERLKALLADDVVILAVGAYGIAAINFVLTVLVHHVRINFYDNRFLTLTSLFGPLSGLLTLFLIIRWGARHLRLGDYASPAFILAGALLLVLKFPAAGHAPEYKTLKETALALAQKSPRGVLIGGYWSSYVFQSLQPVDAMTAIPLEGEALYTPWAVESVRRADRVVVEYRRANLGGTASPPERFTQYGAKLRLVEPKWYENDGFAFALYEREE